MRMTNFLFLTFEFLSFVLLIFCRLTSAQREAANIVDPPVSTAVVDGRSAFFICRAQGNPQPTVSFWNENNREYVTKGFVRVIKLSYGAVLRIDKVNRTAQIQRVRCFAKNQVGSKEAIATLKVYESSEDCPQGFPRIEEGPVRKFDQMGKTVRFKCNMSGNPKPEIIWLKDSVPVLRGDPRIKKRIDNSIEIQRTQESDKGSYECVGRNKHGAVFSQPAMLDLREMNHPPTIFTTGSTTINVKSGQGANLTCRAKAYPEPKVLWKSADGTQISEEKPKQVSLFLTDITESKVLICQAQNSLGLITEEFYINIKSSPDPPTKVTVDPVGPTHAVVNWVTSRSISADSYTLMLALNSSDMPGLKTRQLNSIVPQSESDTRVSYKVTQLEPNKVYWVQVYSVNNRMGMSQPSDRVFFKTGEQPPSSPPKSVRALAKSNTSIRVIWRPPEKPNGKIDHYKIYYTTNLQTSLSSWDMKTTLQEEVIIKGLTSNATYYIRVNAHNSAGDGPVSEPKPIIVRPGAPSSRSNPLPSSPRNLHGVGKDATTILIMWEQPDSSEDMDIRHYVLRVKSRNSGHYVEEKIPYGKTEYEMSHLNAGTLYDVSLFAQSRDGPGVAAQIEVNTLNFVPDQPRAGEISVVSPESIEINWFPPKSRNNEVRYYIVSYAPKPFTSWMVTDSVPLNAKSPDLKYTYTIKGLKSNTWYKVKIAAANKKGRSIAHEYPTVQTWKPMPSEPLNVKLADQRIVQINNREFVSLQLTWKAPKNVFSKLSGYRVKYKDMGPVGSYADRDRGEELSPVKSRIVEGLRFKSTPEDGFKCSRIYSFEIEAIDSKGYKGMPASITIHTIGRNPLGTPLYVNLTPFGRSLNVTWSPPEGIHNLQNVSYLVSISKVGDESGRGKLIRTRKPFLTVHNLTENNDYRVQVAVDSNKGRSGWTSPTSVFIKSPAPPPPDNISGYRLNEHEIKVTWTMPRTSSSSQISGFQIIYSPVDNPSNLENWLRKTVPPVTMTKLTDLNATAQYIIRIRSLSESGDQGDFSNGIVLRSTIIPKSNETNVKRLSCHSSTNSITVTWNSPKLTTGLKEFQIIARSHKSFENEWGKLVKNKPIELSYRTGKDAISLGSYNYMFSHLEPNTVYDIQVEAHYNLNNVIRSETQTSCRTKMQKPNKVYTPEILTVNQKKSVISVKIFRLSERYGKIQYYYLIVAPETMATNSPRSYNLKSIVNDSKHKPSSKSIYLAAKFTKLTFGSENFLVFHLGKSLKTDPQILLESQMDNKVLIDGQNYRCFVRACVFKESPYFIPGDDDCASSKWSDAFNTRKAGQPIEAGVARPPFNVFTVSIVAVIITLAIIAIICIGVGCFMRQKPKYQRASSHPVPIDVNMKQPLMAPPPFKVTSNNGTATVSSNDPVEIRRINFQTPGMLSHPPIPINRLSEHIAHLKINDHLLFSEEYESIDPGQQFTWENSNLEVNKPKNRYANVIAYDHSRVVLQTIDNMPGSDYINSNYIDGYRKQNAYIATQGPLGETFGAFWRMVWEQRSAMIVMMTRLEERTRVKCDQYWPNRGSESYENLLVTHLDSVDLVYYTIRSFGLQRLTCPGGTPIGEKREIRQFQFTAWPDHGVPDNPIPLLMFMRRVRSSVVSEMGPMVVHCSAGVGRTGAFIVIDSMLERIKHEKTVDVYGYVTCLRAQRNYMVQTEDQYVFIHEALLEAVSSGNTEVPARSLYSHITKLRQIDPMTQCAGMELEFKKLTQYKIPNARFTSANLPVNKLKNRLVNVLPYESTRVCLQPIRGVEGSDYINANFIDGYKLKKAYIATQGPLAESTEDFWRMLWEYNSTIVVMLTKLREGRDKCYQYWPSERSARYQYFVVDPMVEYNMPNFILREFKVTDARDGQSRTVRQFQFTDWPDHGVPTHGEAFIDFIGQVHKTKEQFGQDGPISVHCSAGVGRTGVFLCLSIVLERMRFEGVVDMYQTVKLLRTQRPNIIQSEDQYHFCYLAAHEYLSSFDHYAA